MPQLKQCFAFGNVSYSALKSCLYQVHTPSSVSCNHACNHSQESESWNNYAYSNINRVPVGLGRTETINLRAF